MAAAVEAGPEVALQNPWRRMRPGEHIAAWLEGLRGGPLGAEALGMRSAHRLRNGSQGEQVYGLHRPVVPRGERQRAVALRAVPLRTVDTPAWERAIASLSQLSDGVRVLLRGVPYHAVPTRGLPAIVSRHSLPGKRFATAQWWARPRGRWRGPQSVLPLLSSAASLPEGGHALW